MCYCGRVRVEEHTDTSFKPRQGLYLLKGQVLEDDETTKAKNATYLVNVREPTIKNAPLLSDGSCE